MVVGSFSNELMKVSVEVFDPTAEFLRRFCHPVPSVTFARSPCRERMVRRGLEPRLIGRCHELILETIAESKPNCRSEILAACEKIAGRADPRVSIIET